MAQGDIWVATEAAQVTVGGQEMALIPGQTTVREGHPVLKQFPDWFKPFEPSYDTTPDGDDSAPRSQVRGDSRGARTR
jgi:hypothetical protein